MQTIIQRGTRQGRHSSFRRGLSRQLRATRLTEQAHVFWKEVLKEGDTAVDGTCGNGYDTLVLSQLLSTGGRVVGFDIQVEALDATRALLNEELSIQWTQDGDLWKGKEKDGVEIELMLKSHEALRESVREAKVVCFNLGYLPGGDKKLTTYVASTLIAVEAATDIVTPGGVVTVMTYPGHEEGLRECDSLQSFFQTLPSEKWWIVESTVLNRKKAPILTTLYRL